MKDSLNEMSESELHSWRRVREADLPAMWSGSSLSEPVMSSWYSGIKMGDDGRSEISQTLRFTRIKTAVCCT